MTDKEKKDIIDNIKSRLRDGKELIQCDVDEIDYIKKPIGNSIYRTATENKKKGKKKYISEERIICELCGKEYRRSNKSHHERTSFHMTYKTVNDKFRHLLLN
jgi:hypothetical protein